MNIRPRHVLQAVSHETGIPIEMIMGRARWLENVAARRLYYHAAKEFGLHATVIGYAVNRDRSTVIEVTRRRKLSEAERAELNRVKELTCRIAEKKFKAFKADIGKALDRHRAEILERAE